MRNQCTRRGLVVTVGAAAVAAACGGQIAEAQARNSSELSAVEKSNVDLLKQFLGTFKTPDFDIDKTTATFLAPTGSLRWADSEAPAIGPDAAAAAAKRLFTSGMHVEITYLKILARGPLVATSRVDVVKVPGKPDVPVKVAGVAIIKDGKIQEYCDYIF